MLKANVDNRMLRLGAIPHVRQRLKAVLTRNDFPDRVDELAGVLESLEEATVALRDLLVDSKAAGNAPSESAHMRTVMA